MLSLWNDCNLAIKKVSILINLFAAFAIAVKKKENVSYIIREVQVSLERGVQLSNSQRKPIETYFQCTASFSVNLWSRQIQDEMMVTEHFLSPAL